jgi:hypothetical protein
VGTFAGLTCGGVLGMDKGMHKLRESLPKDSRLLQIIHENDQLKQQQTQETLFSGPIISDEDKENSSLFNDDSINELQNDITKTDTQLEPIENQLALDDGPTTQQ